MIITRTAITVSHVSVSKFLCTNLCHGNAMLTLCAVFSGTVDILSLSSFFNHPLNFVLGVFFVVVPKFILSFCCVETIRDSNVLWCYLNIRFAWFSNVLLLLLFSNFYAFPTLTSLSMRIWTVMVDFVFVDLFV